jgi:hypothetical protein
VLIVILLYVAVGVVSEHPNYATVTYGVYYVDAPFGRLYADGHGQWSLLGGGISTTASEAYTIKYWDSGELKTIVVDATSQHTRILVDGTLSFEIVYVTSVCHPLAPFLPCRINTLGPQDSVQHPENHEYSADVYIHLPSLPQLQT